MRERGWSAAAVRLVDISALGCRIELISDLQPDSWVWLKLPGLEARYSRVAWCRGGFAGIEFEAPLHEAVLDVLAGLERVPTPQELGELRRISARCRVLAASSEAGDDETSVELIALARDCEAGAESHSPR